MEWFTCEYCRTKFGSHEILKDHRPHCELKPKSIPAPDTNLTIENAKSLRSIAVSAQVVAGLYTAVIAGVTDPKVLAEIGENAASALKTSVVEALDLPTPGDSQDG